MRSPKLNASWKKSVIGGVHESAIDLNFDAISWTCVYFIQAESGPIKIGTTNSLFQRLSAIQTGNHENLKIIGALTGDDQSEKEHHEKFAHLRIRGEWFRPGDDLLSYIYEVSEYADPVDLSIVPIRPGYIWGVADKTSRSLICLMSCGYAAEEFITRFNRIPFKHLMLTGMHIPIDMAAA